MIQTTVTASHKMEQFIQTGEKKGRAMKLDRWMASHPTLIVLGKGGVEVMQVTADSRDVCPAAVFVACHGTRQEGGQYVEQAIERGALAIVSEQFPDPTLVQKWPDVTFIQVPAAPAALASLAALFYGEPAQSLCLIGITGTNGKTTTSFLLHKMLQAAGFQCGLIGTIHYDLGGGLPLPATHTTPDAVTLHRLFRTMREGGATGVVMEVSSHALAQGRVTGCRFALSIFTNLTQDHFDYHEDFDAYYAAKKKLFDQTDGFQIINTDDPWGRKLWDALEGRGWSYGMEATSDFYPKEIVSDWKGTRLVAATPDGEIEVSSSMAGRYNVYNLLAGIAAGWALGLSKEAMARGIASLTGVPGRFETLHVGQKFHLVVDYAHTEDALTRLLAAVADLHPNRILTVFGCGGDRDQGKRSKMGRVAITQSDYVMMTSDNPRTEDPEAIVRQIEEGVLSAGDASKGRYEILLDREAAIARAIEMARDGDAVVIAGKGHETVQIIGSDRLHFDDREVATKKIIWKLNHKN